MIVGERRCNDYDELESSAFDEANGMERMKSFDGAQGSPRMSRRPAWGIGCRSQNFDRGIGFFEINFHCPRCKGCDCRRSRRKSRGATHRVQ
jgi:hypothetical protein